MKHICNVYQAIFELKVDTLISEYRIATKANTYSGKKHNAMHGRKQKNNLLSRRVFILR